MTGACIYLVKPALWPVEVQIDSVGGVQGNNCDTGTDGIALHKQEIVRATRERHFSSRKAQYVESAGVLGCVESSSG